MFHTFVWPVKTGSINSTRRFIMAGLASLISPKPQIVIWRGASRTAYEMQNDSIGATYRIIPGVYVFCRQISNDKWQAIYVGETDNLARRLTDELAQHHAWKSIIAAGATHICTLHVPGVLSERLNIETDLRHSLIPVCNRQ
jgi:hypothetical protein